jgi:alpha-L-fucosidase
MPNNIYPATSPYFNTTVVNNKFLDVMTPRPIPKDPSDVYYTITQVYEYRPDLLAYDLYGDSRLWWVFAERNPNRLSRDPYFEFVSGIQIYIPQLSTLQQALGI